MKELRFLRKIVRVTAAIAPIALCLPAHADVSSPRTDPTYESNREAPEIGTPKHVEDDHQSFGSGVPRPMVRRHHLRGPAVPHRPRRVGLAVIADFADSQLEDWHGEGIGSIDALSEQLRNMEEHWAWLSRGQESFHWDIIRITLPVTLRPDAYSNWVEFRNAVGLLIRQRVDPSRYDANHDGVIDSAWIVASNKGMKYDYLGGGASRNTGVNMFVDGQTGGSVTAGATGNFNHELAHTIGVPDLYGPYGTLAYLTVMADSWALPPQDFTAYERSLLGWVKPRVIDQRDRHVHLSTAAQHMEAVRISTSRASEYFLMEYRRRPDSGFGSNAPPYDGVAVYHVFEDANQWMDPPLLKLEAADGHIAPEAAPEQDDFLYPGNPNMNRPLILRSYFGGQEVARIDNLRWTGGNGLSFDVEVAPYAMTEPLNLLANHSFEQGTSASPDAWQTNAWVPTANFSWETRLAKDGRRSVGISAATPNDAGWSQTVSGLAPTKAYQFCGWVRGKDIVIGLDAPVGANVSVVGGFVRSESRSGTFGWEQACVIFRPETSDASLACRLGFYGSTVTGSMWCDDMTLVPLSSAFD
jgi:hypothetical protein